MSKAMIDAPLHPPSAFDDPPPALVHDRSSWCAMAGILALAVAFGVGISLGTQRAWLDSRDRSVAVAAPTPTAIWTWGLHLPPGVPESFQLEDVSIRLSRSGCYGPCPAYNVTIRGDGRVTYHGLSDVAIRGKREAQIGRRAVEKLLQRFYDVEFLAMPEDYGRSPHLRIEADGMLKHTGSLVIDSASLTITLHLGSYEKTVTTNLDKPDRLYELATDIDVAAGTPKWVGGR